MTASYNLLGKLQQHVIFNNFYRKIFSFSKTSTDFVVVNMAPDKRSFRGKNIIKETHTCSRVMGGIGVVIASQNRKIISFLTIYLSGAINTVFN